MSIIKAKSEGNKLNSLKRTNIALLQFCVDEHSSSHVRSVRQSILYLGNIFQLSGYLHLECQKQAVVESAWVTQF